MSAGVYNRCFDLLQLSFKWSPYPGYLIIMLQRKNVTKSIAESKSFPLSNLGFLYWSILLTSKIAVKGRKYSTGFLRRR